MSDPLANRVSRRSALKLGAALVAGLAAGLPARWPAAPAQPLAAASLRVVSTLPLPGYRYLANPERLLQPAFDGVDAALVPAYVAATLIERGRVRPVGGAASAAGQVGRAGRAHDPEGHFTIPFAYRVAALRYPGPLAAPRAAAWADLWRSVDRPPLVPAWGRVAVGAALLQRGYSPNDTHAGRLAQAGRDLARLRPDLAQEPAPRQNGALALVLADPAEIGPTSSLRLPAEGTLLIEYDWVVTAGPIHAAAARQFVEGMAAQAIPLSADWPVRLIPLMPLPAAAQAQHAQMWAALAG